MKFKFLKAPSVFLLLALIALSACQAKLSPLEQDVYDAERAGDGGNDVVSLYRDAANNVDDNGDAKDHFVGGVVVNHNGIVMLRDKISQRVAFVFANSKKQSDFSFPGRPETNRYDIEVAFSFFQDCRVSDGAGDYENFPVFSVRVLCADENGKRWSGNPILRNAYTADPSILVEGDTLYLYAGRDEASFFHANPARCADQCPAKIAQMLGNFDITGIHIYKTKNMVDWEYVGPAVIADETQWMLQTWASQIIKRNGKYYLYTSSPVIDNIFIDAALQTFNNFLGGEPVIASGPTAHVGVAISDSPEGPFVDQGFAMITQDMPNAGVSIMDPGAFIDDDGQAYIFYGGGGKAKYAKLADDMVSLDGPIKDVVLKDGSPMPGFTEGPYIHKHNDKYYFSYSASKIFEPNGPLRYAIGDSPEGPWTFMGDLLGPVDILTNHGAVATFKGQDYLFYHTGLIPGAGFFFLKSLATRAVSVDVLSYEADGSINLVEQTRRGVVELP